MIDWKERAVNLAKLVRDLLEIVESGPCCGSGDELTSHYHCPKCGTVGGMYTGLGEHNACKPDLEYQKKNALPGLVDKACDEILETGTTSESLNHEG
jgi:hypothetical protein